MSTILLIEDNAITRKMVRVALEAEGHRVLEAGNGAEALALAAGERPGLVLQDLVLPDMDGFRLLPMLRGALGPNVPVIAFTGFISRREDDRITSAGFDDILLKPVVPSRLVAVVAERLGAPAAPPPPTRRVLAVDDDPSLRRLIAVQLEQLGWEVQTASSGADAMTVARAWRPDVILSDLLMPGMDGYQLVAALRNDPALAAIPVVLQTANVVETEDREAAAAVGAQEIRQRSPSQAGLNDALEGAVARGVAAGAGADAASVLEQDRSQRFLTQLERQADAHLVVAQRAELRGAALAALAAIANALDRGVAAEVAAEEVLARCVDAAGLSRAAILLRRADGVLAWAAHIGFDAPTRTRLERLLQDHPSLDAILHGGIPVTLTPGGSTFPQAQELLATAAASSAMLAPVVSEGQQLGVLLLASATRLLSGDDWNAFAHTIASQLGKAIALRRTVERLESSERRYRTLFETVNLIALTLDRDGLVTYANPYFLRITGFHADQVLGKSWFLFVPERERRALEAMYRDTHFPEHNQNAILTASGSERMVSWHNTVLRDASGNAIGSLSMGEDITARQRTEAALQASERRHTAILDAALDAVITMDATGVITGWNPQAEAMFGWTAKEALRRSVSETVVPTGTREEHEQGLHRFLAEGIGAYLNRRVEVTAQRRNGATFPAELAITPLREGDAWAFSAFVRDLSERKQLEAQLIQAQRMEAVGQLAGGIAHDFNNLLAAITVFTELAGADLPAGSSARDDLEQVQGAVQRAMALTRQLLAFSRQQVVQPKILELNAVINDIEKMLRRVIGEDIALETELAPNAGAVRCDAGQIEQILMNLAVNARDAMPGGGRLVMRTGVAELDADAAQARELKAGRYVTLTVADTGEGMDDATKARAFEPFFTTKGRKGTGLGLATVYTILRQCEGHIALESARGRGTTFTMHFPAVDAPPDAVASAQPSASPRGSETIVLAEDDPAVRHAATTILRRLGYRVLPARSGEEALAALDASGTPVDAVIADIVMPGMDGIQLVNQVRARYPNARAILTSGYATDVMERHGTLPAGVPFLEKPFTSSALARKTREVLDAQ